MISYAFYHSDEKLVLRFFGKESGSKVEGLEAAAAGAIAGMLAQAVTTPVSFRYLLHAPVEGVFFSLKICIRS